LTLLRSIFADRYRTDERIQTYVITEQSIDASKFAKKKIFSFFYRIHIEFFIMFVVILLEKNFFNREFHDLK